MKRMLWTIAALALVAVAMNVQAAQERQYKDIMRDVSRTFRSLVRSIEGQDKAQAEADARKMETLFQETHAFWAKTKTQDAMGFASRAGSVAADTAKAATGGRWDAAGTASEAMSAHCKSCHDSYREKAPDGTYRIKGRSN